MIFNKLMETEKIPDNENVIYREAVRAIAFNFDGQVVMVRSKMDDYQFPGGGIEGAESQLETLRREAMEEAGIVIKEDAQLVGIVEERRKSLEIDDVYFVMTSAYYLCDVKSYVDVQLEEYEKEWGYTPAEVTIEEAYRKNVDVLQQQKQINQGVERDTLVLKCLLDHQDELLAMRNVYARN